MKRHRLTIIAAIFGATFALSANAARSQRSTAPSGEFSFQIESEGRVLQVYDHRGKSYVEGSYGHTYAIRVFNHTGRRIEAVVTVDGRDVISGKVGNYNKGRGYVIDPYDSVLIEGFRRSWQNVAAFTFTSIDNAYAARIGDARNVGVIGVAVFKEKTYRPKTRPRVVPAPSSDQNLGTGYGRRESEKKSGGAASRGRAYESAPADEAHSQGLGTEYGDDTYAPSTTTTFTRGSHRPSAIMAVRYDDREGLVSLGVLPRPRPYYHAPHPDPFPSSPEPVRFAPPPPPRRW